MILESGEEVHSALSAFAAANEIEAASPGAFGAFEHATVGWFDLVKKTYKRIEIAEQCEAMGLPGDIAVDDAGQPGLALIDLSRS